MSLKRKTKQGEKMIWYLLNIAILTIAYLLPERQNLSDIGQDVGQQKRKRICIVGTITWVLLSGLRHISIGADTSSYKYIFNSVKKLSCVFPPVIR